MESREQTLQSGKKRNAMRKDLRMNGGASTGFGAVGKLLLAVAGLLGVAFFPVREARGADSAVAVWSDFAMSLTSGDYTIVLGEGTTVDDDGAIVMGAGGISITMPDTVKASTAQFSILADISDFSDAGIEGDRDDKDATKWAWLFRLNLEKSGTAYAACVGTYKGGCAAGKAYIKHTQTNSGAAETINSASAGTAYFQPTPRQKVAVTYYTNNTGTALTRGTHAYINSSSTVSFAWDGVRWTDAGGG